MAVKLIDLQLIYGVAGAREKFEDLASKLVRAEVPDADKVRTKTGDGGIDVYSGDINDPSGIDVFQCKFFQQGIEDSQKGQIRDSYSTCRDSLKFKMKSWTLCLPLDMTVEERKWFNDWRAKQVSDGIQINDPWAANTLEELLYRDKNKGIKEAFFKEEHLTQIRQLHDRLTALLQDISARLAGVAQADAIAADQKRHQTYLDSFATDMRSAYLKASKPPHPPIAFTINDDPVYNAKLDKQFSDAKRFGYWEIFIYPESLSCNPRVSTLNACLDLVKKCRSEAKCISFPTNTDKHFTGADWAGCLKEIGKASEGWRMSQQGFFGFMGPIRDDVNALSHRNPHWDRNNYGGEPPTKFLDIDVALSTITFVFRFATALTHHLQNYQHDKFAVDIKLEDTAKRALIASNDPLRLHGCYQATQSVLQNKWPCSAKDLQTNSDHLARDAAIWFFERFGWFGVDAKIIGDLQAKMLPES